MNSLVIVFFSSLFAALILLAGGYLFLKHYFKKNAYLKNLLDKLDLEEVLSPLIDEKMEGLLAKIGLKFPMAAMFLNGSMGQQLQGMAKEEVIEMLPALKEQLLQKATQKIDLSALISEKLCKWGPLTALSLAAATTFLFWLSILLEGVQKV